MSYIFPTENEFRSARWLLVLLCESAEADSITVTPRAVEAGLSLDTHAEANADTIVKKRYIKNWLGLNLLRGKPPLACDLK